jgi:hypothetical protein
MAEADKYKKREILLRRLEAELDEFEELFASPDEYMPEYEDSWYRYVARKIEDAVDLYPDMTDEQKQRFRTIIDWIREQEPTIDENDYEYPEIIDRLDFSNGELVILPEVSHEEVRDLPNKPIMPSFNPKHYANILDCLGFAFFNDYEYSEFLRSAANKEEPLFTRHGSYVNWVFGNGIEIWSQIDQRHRVVAMKPHFDGQNTQMIAIERGFPRADNPLDGTLVGWLNPDVGRNGDEISFWGSHPIVFDSPAFDWYHEMPFPLVARVHLSAFAKAFDIVEADLNDHPNSSQPVQLAQDFFIPSGTFADEQSENPIAEAIFGGTVLECRVLYNMISKKNFTRATIRTHGMDIDTVIAPHSLKRPLEKGDIVRGVFWLSGKVLELMETFTKEAPIYRGRLFGEMALAGVEFQDVEERIKQLSYGEQVFLMREPDNSHDPRAIAVLTRENIKLGYIPRSQNYVLAKLLDLGKQIACHVVNKFIEPRPIIYVRVYLPLDKE